MIKLTYPSGLPRRAAGVYKVTARGFVAAVLRWADENGPLEDWTAFAYVPLDPGGSGSFRLRGLRSAPLEATHISVRAVGADLAEVSEALFPIPGEAAGPPGAYTEFGVLSDLHLSAKPWAVRRALLMAGASGQVLCTGDMTNDGLPEQFVRLRDIVDELLPEVPFLAVSGNHDYPHLPLPLVQSQIVDVPSMQTWLLRRAFVMGREAEEDESGAYAVSFGGIDLVGLNAATQTRRLSLKEGGQLRFLARRLDETDAYWHVVLCHAPLAGRNPQRPEADMAPYFGGDPDLRRILDGHRNVVFLSGHTHFSVNCTPGCIELDSQRENLFINCGSVCPTSLKADEPLQGPDWTDGCIFRLRLAQGFAEARAVSVKSGKNISRGYFRL